MGKRGAQAEGARAAWLQGGPWKVVGAPRDGVLSGSRGTMIGHCSKAYLEGGGSTRLGHVAQTLPSPGLARWGGSHFCGSVCLCSDVIDPWHRDSLQQIKAKVENSKLWGKGRI